MLAEGTRLELKQRERNGLKQNGDYLREDDGNRLRDNEENSGNELTRNDDDEFRENDGDESSSVDPVKKNFELTNLSVIEESFTDIVQQVDLLMDELEEIFSEKMKRFSKLNKILVTGEKGNGKTLFLRLLQDRCGKSGYHAQYLDLNEESPKRKLMLHNHLAEAAVGVLRNSSGVLLLDNYDNVSECKDVIFKVLDATFRPMVVVATSSIQDTDSMFFNHVVLKSSSSKMALLRNKLRMMLGDCDELDGEKYSLLLQSCSNTDVHTIAQQLIHKAALTEDFTPNHLHIHQEIFDDVLKDFKPFHLRSLPPSSDANFSSVGGLKDVKEVLIETFLWPCRFPSIFKDFPMKRGVLLYGPPGTGKTLLASALAAELGVALITVKGPELLSKYIGESENGVRRVFQKARECMPCLLFFDELDSLTPRRGHDSSGVTDRVVNQLLAEMDGVDGGEVFVLAATNRIDLLDPALLRPGRMDKLIYCSLPSLDDRLEILKCLLKHPVRLHTDVSLKELAQRTKHFTGADLKALVYNALVNVSHEIVGNGRKKKEEEFNEVEDDGCEDKKEKDVSIEEDYIPLCHQRHFISALSQTHPSITPQLIKNYLPLNNQSHIQYNTGQKITHAWYFIDFKIF